MGADGYLHVTTTTWTPFNLEVGGQGGVYRVDPSNGKAELLASGAEPTNLALSGGKIYITEHAAGGISVLKHGKVSEYLPLPGAVSIEAGRHGSLYAGTDFTGPGSIVRVDTHKGRRR